MAHATVHHTSHKTHTDKNNEEVDKDVNPKDGDRDGDTKKAIERPLSRYDENAPRETGTRDPNDHYSHVANGGSDKSPGSEAAKGGVPDNALANRDNIAGVSFGVRTVKDDIDVAIKRLKMEPLDEESREIVATLKHAQELYDARRARKKREIAQSETYGRPVTSTSRR